MKILDFAAKALRVLPPELAHALAIRALSAGLVRGRTGVDPPVLASRLWGLDFPNPVGIAAGFDKSAEAYQPLLSIGAGFVEIGTVTPRSQAGNPRPRIFRFPRERAVVNRLGFNNDGMNAVAERLASRNRARGVVGVNVGRNRASRDAAADYRACFDVLGPLADYVAVNVSSPNTPGVRDLQERAALDRLIGGLQEARDDRCVDVPILVKIAPDLGSLSRREIASLALERGIDGLIVSNTTVARPVALSGPARNEAGGLSGRPLLAPSTALLADMYRLTGGRIPLIGVGGIAGADDAYMKIRAGASLVQLYTALSFQGLQLLGEIKNGLAARLAADGFGSVAEAIGQDAGAGPDSPGS